MPRRGDRDSKERPTGGTKPDGERRTRESQGELALDPKKLEGMAKLREQIGKDGFIAQLDVFRAEFGLPDPFDVLQLVFENHKDVGVRVEALQKMDAEIDKQADSTKQVFRTRVKLLQMTAREPELKKAAVRIAKARGY